MTPGKTVNWDAYDPNVERWGVPFWRVWYVRWEKYTKHMTLISDHREYDEAYDAMKRNTQQVYGDHAVPTELDSSFSSRRYFKAGDKGMYEIALTTKALEMPL